MDSESLKKQRIKEKKRKYKERKREKKNNEIKKEDLSLKLKNNEIEKEDLSLKLKNKLNSCKTKRTKDSFEQKSFRSNLRKNSGNVMKTMESLNIDENKIGDIINKIDLLRK